MMMKQKPILFSAPMIQAINAGLKTKTRRVITPQPQMDEYGMWHWKDCRWKDRGLGFPKSGIDDHSIYQPGDILWVRETWCEYNGYFHYKESEISNDAAWLKDKNIKWRPSIHMPRTAARLFLRVIDVKVEQLQDITQDDAIAEGFTDGGCTVCGNSEPCGCDALNHNYVDSFVGLWNQLNEKRGYGWFYNPWVWVYEFERTEVPNAKRTE